MPRTKRKDKSRAVLRTGESQRADGTYQFRWTDSNHKRFCVYAKTLDELTHISKASIIKCPTNKWHFLSEDKSFYTIYTNLYSNPPKNYTNL